MPPDRFAWSAFAPKAEFAFPFTFATRALWPKAASFVPVVFAPSAARPKAELPLTVLLKSASLPNAALSLPVELE